MYLLKIPGFFLISSNLFLSKENKATSDPEKIAEHISNRISDITL